MGIVDGGADRLLLLWQRALAYYPAVKVADSDSASVELPSLAATAHGERAYLIGIGGAGMRSLADVLRGRGWRVTGSDAFPRADARGLSVGHHPDHVPHDATLVVYSAAVGPENCERRRAAQLGVPQLSYPEMLGRLAAEKTCLAVAGTHGKSTVTAMAAAMLREAGLAPTVVCGAEPLDGPSGQAGDGPHFLVEACEYRRHFLQFRPQAAVLLNIEPDHFDYYRSDDELLHAFGEFITQIEPDGLLIFSADCAASRQLAQGRVGRKEAIGFGPDADWYPVELVARRGHYEFCLCHGRETLGQVTLQTPGRHQIANALAAAALTHAAGADSGAIVRGLSGFRGLRRRLEPKQLAGIPWLDDYAHHPTEVAAALATARQLCPQGRIWCTFQPHQASRTARLLRQFAESLEAADKIAVAEVFRAREGPPEPGEVTAADLAALARAGGADVLAGHSESVIQAWLTAAMGRGELTPDDIIVTMGAGNLGKIGYGFSDWIGTIRSAG